MPIVGTSRLRSRNKFRISQLVSAISRQLLIAIGAEAAKSSHRYRPTRTTSRLPRVTPV